jgi:hypothetical protein
MTLNWGHKLILVFLAFGAGMSFLVYQSMHTRYDLVSKDYYKDELAYQQVIDATNRANQLTGNVIISQTGETLTLQLPAAMKHTVVTGDTWFYCATDAGKDRKIPLTMNEEAQQVINKKLFLPGNYTVKINWQSNGRQYYAQQTLTIQ